MIKRSTGFFKIAFFIFCLFIAFFLIAFSLTDIRNYVTAEMCIISFCVSITIIPMVLEWIVYAVGILTKGIRVSTKEEVIAYKSMKNSQVPYTSLNDNGIEKMMFFCDKGRITLLTSTNTEIHWGCDKDEIHMKTKFGECYSVFKGIYGTKYENVECEVYTMLPEVNVVKESAKKTDTPQKASEVADVAPKIEENSQLQPAIQSDTAPTENSLRQVEVLESNEEFDYALKETDTLFEETIKL